MSEQDFFSQPPTLNAGFNGAIALQRPTLKKHLLDFWSKNSKN